jgi:antitoxin VapB
VEISRNSNGDLVIHPIPVKLGDALLLALNAFDDDFASVLEMEQRDQAMMQDRDAL